MLFKIVLVIMVLQNPNGLVSPALYSPDSFTSYDECEQARLIREPAAAIEVAKKTNAPVKTISGCVEFKLPGQEDT